MVNLGIEKWSEQQLGKGWKKIVKTMQDGQGKVGRRYRSVKRGDFTRYSVKFNTSDLNKGQVTKTYGSIKSGRIGAINGFKGKKESWRMLNVLLHDRKLHQRYGRSLVKATHTLDVDYETLKRKLGEIVKNG